MISSLKYKSPPPPPGTEVYGTIELAQFPMTTLHEVEPPVR